MTESLAHNAVIRLANIEDILCTLIHIVTVSAVINIARLHHTQ